MSDRGRGAAASSNPCCCSETEKLADGLGWLYEIKLDGFRAIAFKSGGKVRLRLRNDNGFNGKYLGIMKALSPPRRGVLDKALEKC